ncbi:tRNA(Ile)-lysidine synthase [Alkalibacterium putridalgicola]|uniref:tRNA(Ile)-lysidine synthase n=1 Tax=Alkalibacterium putridalgicola TaxID=426703 RepID=A0A1H7W4E0_9LACT|nr:tRNA lysidine(34) synthetase TilS [Alkalibacterium putridalgicola]GEK89998.1 tRNA(Ile)-lysidine synthase [Alkalibacterium putridalgicola]SEM16184.1 tRNA(Ile)-lysidine synthase [Alkalibacterium putridalgicola]
MDLAEDFLNQIQSKSYWRAGESIVVGVSGGVDSMVLFDLLNQLPDDCRPDIHVAHVNHQLRPESDAEEHFIKKWMKTYAVPVHTYTWNKTDHPAAGIEQAARNVRYRFFSEVAEKVNSRFILTAHHRDDQVETVLMRLVRGSSLDELTGISNERPAEGRIVLRLLLPYSKDRILNYARENAVSWREDESNQSSLYTRNRFRHHIIPELKLENPALEKHIYDFSSDMNDLLKVVEPLIEAELARSFGLSPTRMQLNLSSFLTQEHGFQKIVLRRAFKKWRTEQVYAISQQHVDLLLDWFEAGGPNTYLELPGRLTAQKEYDKCIIEEAVNSEETNASDAVSEVLELGQWKVLNETEKIGWFTYETFRKMVGMKGQIIYLAEKGIEWPLVVRHREPGDKMKVKGLDGSKKIKDVFIDQKVPRKKRDEAWLITDSRGQIVWLAGYKESPLSLNPLTDTIIYVLIYQKNTAAGIE